MPTSWKTKKIAGKEWTVLFTKRHKGQISLRKAENTSFARIRGFNKNSVDKFYSSLNEVMLKYNFEPSRIVNVDETGTQLGQAVSAERGSLITVVGIITAEENYLPPVYIFPRVLFKDTFTRRTLAGSIGLCNKSGWSTADLFIDILKHIEKRHMAQP